MLRKILTLFLICLIGGMMYGQFASAATSNFGEKALLFGKALSGDRMGTNKNLTDGLDNTGTNLYGGLTNAFRVYGALIPQAYVDQVFVRSISASGTVGVRLTFVDGTTETITIAIKAANTSYYAPVTTKSKTVKSYDLYSAGGDFYVSEFDLRQGDYNPSNPSAFVINSLKVTGDHQSATLSWSEINPEYFGQYNVYMNDKIITTITANATHTYVVNNLNQLTDYTFSVSASDQFKKEYGKTTAAYRTAQRPPPPKPSLYGSVDDKTAFLNFRSNSSYVKKYTIYQDGKQISDVQGNSYTVTGLTNGKSYEFTVTAVDDNDAASPLSDVVRLTPALRIVPVPSLSAVPGVGQVKLSFFSDSTFIKKYTIYQDGKQIAEVQGNYYTVTGLTNEKSYSFYVTATDDRDTVSEKSKVATAVPKLPVTESQQEATKDYMLVTWNQTAGAIGYAIFLNGRQIATVSEEVREYKITKEMGYNPNMTFGNTASVKPILADGSLGGSGANNPGTGGSGGSGTGNSGGNDNLPGGSYGIPVNIVGMIEQGLSILKMIAPWILVVMAVIFSPVLYGWVVRWMAYLQRKNQLKRRF